MAGDDLSDYERDKTEKQKLVVKNVADRCTSDSEHDDIRIIAEALGSGLAQLGIDNLSGGYTNYTYKIYLKKLGDEDVPETALFVKLCFPRAFWNPDPDYVYDVKRIENETIMMNKFALLSPGCVATPYLLFDVDDMKLLVTQWSPDDEQLGNQCIDGLMDVRVAKNLAVAVASLHSSELDEDFNTEARECMINMFPSMEDELLSLLTESVNSRAGYIAKSLGPELCGELFERAVKSYRASQIPCHFDLHFFNVLVEAKPDHLEQFGTNGSFCVCDWEGACRGPLGIDMGRIYSIPVACIIAHALGGNCEVVEGMLGFLDVYWEEYSNAMRASGIDDEYLEASYRNALAWLGWKLFAMSIFEWFVPFFPIEPGDVGKFKESLGVVGLRLMRYGFMSDTVSKEDLIFVSLRQTIQDELANIKSSRESALARKRRSSVLRDSNRRVSDSFQCISNRASLKATLADFDPNEWNV